MKQPQATKTSKFILFLILAAAVVALLSSLGKFGMIPSLSEITDTTNGAKVGSCITRVTGDKFRYFIYGEKLIDVEGEVYGVSYTIKSNHSEFGQIIDIGKPLPWYRESDRFKVIPCPEKFLHYPHQLNKWKLNGEYPYLKRAGVI